MVPRQQQSSIDHAALPRGAAQYNPPGEASPRLDSLDQRQVAVQLLAQGRERLLRGVGAYGPDPDLGGVLRVAIRDEAGPYELVFVEGQWSGRIESGAGVGCDYLMHVG